MSTRFASNLTWNISGELAGKLLGPLLQVLVARLLLPDDYGAFGIAVAWLAAFEVVKDWGLTHAIVVRGRLHGDAVPLQFTLELATAAAFYIVTLGAAPLAAELFALPQLREVMWLVGLAAFLGAVADPVLTDCLIGQQYGRIAARQLAAPLLSGVLGLLLAHAGYGVYALVGGLLAGQALGALLLYQGRRSGLRLVFDAALLAHLMPLGKHIVLQRLFGYLVGQADSFIIGRMLGSHALGLYRMAHLLAFLVPGASVSPAGQVVFTELSASGDDAQIRRRYALFTNVCGVGLLAYSVLVYAAAPWVVPALLGPHWREAVPLAQLFAAVVITGFLTPLNIDLSKILGFAHVYTRFAALRAAATVGVLIWAAQFSVAHAVVAWVLVGFAANLANDAIFFLNQTVVRVTFGKLALTGLAWLWAAYVIVRVLN